MEKVPKQDETGECLFFVPLLLYETYKTQLAFANWVFLFLLTSALFLISDGGRIYPGGLKGSICRCAMGVLQ